MAIQGVNSQTRPVQTQQTQNTGFAQPAAQQQQLKNDPLAALSKALEALEQAVSALTSKGFNNSQSVASQANQNLGVSGQSQSNPFDFSNLFQGGSTFDAQPTVQNNPLYQPSTGGGNNFLHEKGGGGGNDFLNGTGGGAGGGNDKAHLNFGHQKSGGGGIRVGSDGANN